MAREQLQNLTEPMYYILLSLLNEKCGVDIADDVYRISRGRVTVGPGTLYGLIGRFQKEGIIRETSVLGRRRNYIITDYGKSILVEEYKRIMSLADDGYEYLKGEL